MMQLNDLPRSVILLVITGVLAAVAAYTMSSIQTNLTCTTNTTAAQCNIKTSTCCIEFPNLIQADALKAAQAAANATSGIAQLSGWLPTIAIVIAAAIIIGVVVGAFVLGKR